MKIFFSGIEELTNEDGNPTSTGLAQAQTVFEKVKQRNCQDSIVGLSYGTTASNTGKDRGAMVRLQRLLDVPLFYLGCRHHIAELLAKTQVSDFHDLYLKGLIKILSFFYNIVFYSKTLMVRR